MTKYADSEDLPDLGFSNFRANSVSIARTAIANVVSVVHGGDNRSIGNIVAQINRDDNSVKQINAEPLAAHILTCPLPNEKIVCIQDGNTGNWYYTGVLSNNGVVNHIAQADRITYEKGTNNPYTGKFFKSHPNSARTVDVIEGDVVVQGRFGQSIRLSHSNTATNTPWSDGARKETTPITILRNGYLPVEDLETDLSSIYLTTDQYINLPLKGKLPQSLQPTQNRYDYGQVIAYSDRVVLGSRTDDILLSSANNVHLLTQNWNHDTDVVLDNVIDLIAEVKKLASEVKQIAQFSSQQIYPVPAVGFTGVSTFAASFANQVAKVLPIEQKITAIEQNINLLKQN